MSTWHDLVSSQPADTQLVWVRRTPGDSPPLPANWDAAHARFLCGPEAWVIPWQFVSHWRALNSEPPWPRPPVAASPWQEIYLCPPAHGQSVWLRRSGAENAAFRAVFDRPNLMFTLARGWQIHWYQAWRWRSG